MGNSGFLSSCDRYFGEPLELQKGSQASVPVAGGYSGLLSSRCGVNGPYLTLRNEFGGFSRIVVENRGSSRVATGTSGNLSCVLTGVRHPFDYRGKILDSFQVSAEESSLNLRRETLFSPVVTWISGFLSSFNGVVRLRLVLRHGTSLCSRVVKGISGLLSS